MEQIDDSLLLLQIKNGNEQVFESVFREHYQKLCNTAIRYLKDEDGAEEVVQDIFYGLWEKRAQLEIKSSLLGYLTVSVKNRCLNQIKHIQIKERYKSYHQEQIWQEENNFSEEIIGSELAGKITNTINLLPPERKKVFELSRFEGLKYKEIAAKLNISVKTVENQMGKALQFLREQLSEYLVVTLIMLAEFFNFF